MNSLSVVITTFNSEETIGLCLDSVGFADEIVILDSFSEDDTVALSKQAGAIVKQQKFKGFSEQKKDAIAMASHAWVLLLDSDEYLSDAAQQAIQQWQKQEPHAHGYHLPRIEWVFWRWSHRWVRHNKFLRLFDKSRMRIEQRLVHESVEIEGETATIKAPIMHFGERSITEKLNKVNHYSRLAAEEKFAKGKRCGVLRVVFYPWFYFIRQYLFKRQIFNGFAGFINASINSYYAFLKYAKLYELRKNRD
ncbi:glycosyltransferase family 2 protein [Marinicella sp. W31]|uniref:glycosyltransferase family 2 protein n=1 Tax=Marinicella sp. W31 TaxID=3023713 RepID=UPI003756928F